MHACAKPLWSKHPCFDTCNWIPVSGYLSLNTYWLIREPQRVQSGGERDVVPQVEKPETSRPRLSGAANGRARAARRGRSGWLVLGPLLLVVLGGCGEEESGQDAASPTASPPTSALATIPDVGTTPTASVQLGEVVWAERIDPTTGEPRATVDAFPAETETVYALAPVRGAPAGSVVSATWALNGTPIEGSTQEVRIADDVAGGWVAFQLRWTGEGAWPPGVLSVSLTANGRPASDGSVQLAR